jgi:hypothetical protein
MKKPIAKASAAAHIHFCETLELRVNEGVQYYCRRASFLRPTTS